MVQSYKIMGTGRKLRIISSAAFICGDIKTIEFEISDSKDD
jgi:hypothetical protein